MPIGVTAFRGNIYDDEHMATIALEGNHFAIDVDGAEIIHRTGDSLSRWQWNRLLR